MDYRTIRPARFDQGAGSEPAIPASELLLDDIELRVVGSLVEKETTTPDYYPLTLNALVAADSVLIPLQCEYLALEGLAALMGTIERVRESLNPSLTVEGLLLTMYDLRNNLSAQVAREARDHFGDLVFKTPVPRNVRLSEAPSHGKPALIYDINSKGAMSYLQLAEELLERINDGHA